MLLAHLRRDQVLARDREVLEDNARLVALAANIEVDVRELEEADGVGLGHLALHHLAGDLARPEIEPASARALSDRVVQTHLPLPAEQVARLDAVVGHLVHDVLGLVDRHRGIGGTDVDHPASLAAVKMSETLDGLGAVEREDRVEVGAQSAVAGLVAATAGARRRPRFLMSKGRQSGMLRSRFRVVWIAKRPRSQAIHLRPSLSATAGVVPEPTKKSATRSPGFDEATRSVRPTPRASGWRTQCAHSPDSAEDGHRPTGSGPGILAIPTGYRLRRMRWDVSAGKCSRPSASHCSILASEIAQPFGGCL